MNKDYYGSGMYAYMNNKEYEKNYMRVHDIMRKADGDIDKAIAIAKTQANRISVDNKAVSRFRVAEHAGFKEIAGVFMKRAFELCQVDTMTYREYQLKTLVG